MQFSSADKALYVKLVYYGPGLSGKTTNIETIHQLTDPNRRQAMVSLKTDGDRTLFFDLLPFELGKMFGMQIRLKLYTVPGQIQYDTTRKQVLAGADGVVFVADSTPSRREHNERMIRYLKSNLQANGLDPEAIPLVFQWNKRDVASPMTPSEMGAQLNWRRVPAIEAVAPVGTGVIETFREITVLTLESLSIKAAALGQKIDTASLRARVAEQLDPFIPDGRAGENVAGATKTIGTIHKQPIDAEARSGGRHREVLGLDALLQEAVQANLSVSDRLAEGPGQEAVQAQARRERKALARLVQIAGLSDEPESLLKIALGTAISGLDRKIGAVLVPGAPGQPLREVAVAGRTRDPLNAIEAAGIGSAAAGLMDRPEPLLCHDIPGELLFGQPHEEMHGLRSMVAVPFGRDAGLSALLLVYSSAGERDLTPDDVELISLIGALTTLVLRGARVGA